MLWATNQKASTNLHHSNGAIKVGGVELKSRWFLLSYLRASLESHLKHLQTGFSESSIGEGRLNEHSDAIVSNIEICKGVVLVVFALREVERRRLCDIEVRCRGDATCTRQGVVGIISDRVVEMPVKPDSRGDASQTRRGVVEMPVEPDRVVEMPVKPDALFEGDEVHFRS
jgi:hypothetical protein